MLNTLEITLLMTFFITEFLFIIWYLPILFHFLGSSFPQKTIEKEGKFIVSMIGIAIHIATFIIGYDLTNSISLFADKIDIGVLIINVLLILSFYYLLPFIIKALKGEDIYWKMERNIFQD